MRLIGAGLFVFASMLAVVAALGSLGIFDRGPVWLIAPLIVVFMFVMIGVTLWLFNAKGANALGHKTLEERIRELEQRDLLESTTFQATRAFGVEEFEDEGSSYFLELSDGRVLFLTGSISTTTNLTRTRNSRARFRVLNFPFAGTKQSDTCLISSVAGECSSPKLSRRLSLMSTWIATTGPQMGT